MTNELLKKNAEKLKMATIETAKESERGIVDMETLKATNESLISTLDEVMNIQREGRQKRQEGRGRPAEHGTGAQGEAAGDSRIVIPLFCSLSGSAESVSGIESR